VLWGAGRVQKSESYDPALPIKTAVQHHRWVEDYGPVHALQLYFRDLLPQLEANDRQLYQVQVRKAEELSVELLAKVKTQIPDIVRRTKAASPEGSTISTHLPSTEVQFQGKKVQPGHAFYFKNRTTIDKTPLALLSADAEGFVGVDPNRIHDYAPQDLVKIPRDGDIAVRRFPVNLEESGTVDPTQHGIPRYLKHPDVQQFVAGMDFLQSRQGALDGITAQRSWWGKNAQGQHAYVKGANPNEHGGFGDAHKEALFHNLARDYFDLGRYIPKVGLLRSPRTGQHVAVVEGLEGNHYEAEDMEHRQARKDQHSAFSRMAVADFAMGNPDRHNRNWFWVQTDKGMEPRFIDHGLTMGESTDLPEPAYINPIHDDYWVLDAPDYSQPMPPEDQNWAAGLNLHEFETQLRSHGVPEEHIALATHRLKTFQETVRAFPNESLSKIWQMANTLHSMPPEDQAEKLEQWKLPQGGK
jgi:hypothetical protein